MSRELFVPRWVVPLGRAFYAAGLIGIGIQHFIFRQFIPVMLPLWPAGLPGRAVFACLLGALMVLAGVAILFDIKGRTVAAWTGVGILLLLVFDTVPSVLMQAPQSIGTWTNAFKALAMAGSAWVMAGSFAEEGGVPEWLDRVMPVGRFFLPIMVVVFGYDHFLYEKGVVTLVPGWAGSAVFWTYFAGVALMASGLAILVGVLPRLAALMLGIMIFLWVPMLHIPRAVADFWGSLGNETTSVFEATAFAGVALVMAALPSASRFSVARRRRKAEIDEIDLVKGVSVR
jgi:uncharacterized membrane protein